MPFTTWAKNKILDEVCGRSSGALDFGNVYLALCTREPVDNGSTLEISEPMSAHGYKRVSLIGAFDNPAEKGVIRNTDEIHFNMATGPWGQIGWAALMNAQQGGTGIAWGELTHPIKPGEDSTGQPEKTVPVLEANSLVISITDK